MPNINDTFFEGHYKEIWKAIIPDELTQKETEFMIPYFELAPGKQVLDLMCGYGRHALALARKGISVMAVDNLKAYTDELCAKAEEEQLPVTVACAPVLEFETDGRFDLALCMGNSLNFFDRADTVKLLQQTATHLNEGGQLLINTWSLAEIVYKQFKERSWSRIGELLFLTDSVLRYHPSRMETESIIIAPDGTREIRPGVDYLYSINEMESMLEEAGFHLKVVYSIPGRKKFTLGEPRAYLVAAKKKTDPPAAGA